MKSPSYILIILESFNSTFGQLYEYYYQQYYDRLKI